MAEKETRKCTWCGNVYEGKPFSKCPKCGAGTILLVENCERCGRPIQGRKEVSNSGKNYHPECRYTRREMREQYGKKSKS